MNHRDTEAQSQEPIPLDKAAKLAAKIVAALAPYCERIQIAGSIRRRRPLVNDIDIVCLPRRGDVAPLRERVLTKTRPISDGRDIIITRLQNGVQLDLWLAQQPKKDLFSTTPTNFGSLLLCRTGSKEHNIWLVEHAKKLGLSWNPHHGVFGKSPRTGAYGCLASATEEDVFAALKLDFVPPEKRER
jgi:DNA polymerase/3'-5' exonuclease PolX